MEQDALGIFTLLPPVLAILLSFITRKIILSLSVAIVSGAVLIAFFQQSESVLLGIDIVFKKYLWGTVSDSDHIIVVLFSLFIAGMVHVSIENRSLEAFLNKFSKRIKTKRGAQLVAYFSGLFVFFDDYANSLIVGQSLTPLFDRFKISREKLAYIVDSTAAPIASIALVSTWIGFEVKEINSALLTSDNVELINYLGNGYSIFLSSLFYSYYSIFTLAFVFLLIWFKKDFGPMRKVSILKEEQNEAFNSKPFLGIIPICILLIVTLLGLVITGEWPVENDLGFMEKLGKLIGSSNSYHALLWGSTSSLIVSVLINLIFTNHTSLKIFGWVFKGIQKMLSAILILILAWALGAVINDLGTADYLTQLMTTSKLEIYWLPVLTFLLAAVISFSTGSSWSTMGIMFPLIIPMLIKMYSPAIGIENWEPIFYTSVASVLGGAVFGDHCSPISDTTLLSSMATGCNHISHVKTQLPYALVVGSVSVVFGILPSTFGVHWSINYVISLVSMILVLNFVARKE